jgi:hypothetical protein
MRAIVQTKTWGYKNFTQTHKIPEKKNYKASVAWGSERERGGWLPLEERVWVRIEEWVRVRRKKIYIYIYTCSKQRRFNCNETTSFLFFIFKIQNDIFISYETMLFLSKVKRRRLLCVDSVRLTQENYLYRLIELNRLQYNFFMPTNRPPKVGRGGRWQFGNDW